VRLSIYIGSLVDPPLGAHAVVNASNPSVGLGSGVSGAIREACGGAAFQRECREALDDQFGDELGPDDCLVTSGGTSTAFRWVLHVPSVDYRHRDVQTGGSTGPDRIRRCVRAAVAAAVELAGSENLPGQFVLATPLLGAGHGGLGAIASLDAMMSGLKDALASLEPSQRAALARIVICVLSPNEARLVTQAADSHGLAIDRL
jgi:O-acetyl-ADP-ribose deacetylase (regulator of RNase III)